MSTLYAKMYATLVGRVDTTLAYMADMLAHSKFDYEHTLHVAQALKTALEEVEEMYLDAEGADNV